MNSTIHSKNELRNLNVKGAGPIASSLIPLPLLFAFESPFFSVNVFIIKTAISCGYYYYKKPCNLF